MHSYEALDILEMLSHCLSATEAYVQGNQGCNCFPVYLKLLAQQTVCLHAPINQYLLFTCIITQNVRTE